MKQRNAKNLTKGNERVREWEREETEQKHPNHIIKAKRTSEQDTIAYIYTHKHLLHNTEIIKHVKP